MFYTVYLKGIQILSPYNYPKVEEGGNRDLLLATGGDKQVGQPLASRHYTNIEYRAYAYLVYNIHRHIDTYLSKPKRTSVHVDESLCGGVLR